MSKLIGSMLVEAGVISQDQLNAALGRQRSYGGRLASTCLHLDFADERRLAVVLSRQLGVPFVILSQSAIPVAMSAELPHGAATKLFALPLRRLQSSLMIALANPKDIATLDQLRFGTGGRLVEHGALIGPLHSAIQDIYKLKETRSANFYQGRAVDPKNLVGDQGHIEVATGEELLVSDGPLLSPVQTPLADLDMDWSEAEVQSQAEAPAGPPTILVVDDEPDIRNLLAEFLEREGFRVQMAADGTEAMKMLQVQLPDLLLLDAMLPGVHGFDICSRVKHSKATSHVPVVMISAIYRGWRYSDDIQRMYGADAFLEKPFNLEELKRSIDRCLKRRPSAAPAAEISARANELLQQAAALYRQGNAAAAAGLLERAVEASPFSADLHQRLARLYDKLDQPYRALAARERVAELDPSYDNLLNLAKLYERTGFGHKAFEAWERCLWVCTDRAQSEAIRQRMDRLLPQG